MKKRNTKGQFTKDCIYSISKNFLLQEYTKNKKTALQIATEIGCSYATIYNKEYWRRYFYETKTIREIRKNSI